MQNFPSEMTVCSGGACILVYGRKPEAAEFQRWVKPPGKYSKFRSSSCLEMEHSDSMTPMKYHDAVIISPIIHSKCVFQV